MTFSIISINSFEDYNILSKSIIILYLSLYLFINVNISFITLNLSSFSSIFLISEFVIFV